MQLQCNYSELQCNYSELQCNCSELQCNYSELQCNYSELQCNFTAASLQLPDERREHPTAIANCEHGTYFFLLLIDCHLLDLLKLANNRRER